MDGLNMGNKQVLYLYSDFKFIQILYRELAYIQGVSLMKS